MPAVGLHQPGDHVEDGGLAGAVRAQQADRLAARAHAGSRLPRHGAICRISPDYGPTAGLRRRIRRAPDRRRAARSPPVRPVEAPARVPRSFCRARIPRYRRCILGAGVEPLVFGDFVGFPRPPDAFGEPRQRAAGGAKTRRKGGKIAQARLVRRSACPGFRSDAPRRGAGCHIKGALSQSAPLREHWRLRHASFGQAQGRFAAASFS